MSTFEIKEASRVNTRPLIGIYGESGTGKTFSALLIARGIVGPKGKIVVIDTESERAQLYADVLPGGFKTVDFAAPFSSERYMAAIQAVEDFGADIGIIDSASHEWEGEGGVTDAAAKIAEASAQKWNKEWNGVVEFGHWKQPKMDHARFVMRMMRSRIPWIVCLRAKFKSRQVKGTKEMADNDIIKQNQIGKQCVVKDLFTSPIQAEDFIYEMTAHFEVLQDHTIHVTKMSHPTLGECFPQDYTKPVTIETGEAIAAWCAGGSVKSRPQIIADPTDLKTAKSMLWAAVKPSFEDLAQLENYIRDKGVLGEDETLSQLDAARLNKIRKEMTA